MNLTTCQQYAMEEREMRYELTNELLRNVFSDTETVFEVRDDGIYEVDGEKIAESMEIIAPVEQDAAAKEQP